MIIYYKFKDHVFHTYVNDLFLFYSITCVCPSLKAPPWLSPPISIKWFDNIELIKIILWANWITNCSLTTYSNTTCYTTRLRLPQKQFSNMVNHIWHNHMKVLKTDEHKILLNKRDRRIHDGSAKVRLHPWQDKMHYYISSLWLGNTASWYDQKALRRN